MDEQTADKVPTPPVESGPLALPPVTPTIIFAPVAEPTAVVLMPMPADEQHDKDTWWERFTRLFRAAA